MFFNVYTCFQISQTHQIPFTLQSKHCTYLQQSCLLPRSAKRCTYLAMPNIALTCNKVATYLAAQSDALTFQCLALHLPATKLLLTLQRPAMHFPATPRVAITFLQRKALQKPPPQSCPSHISTYHSPCVQPPVR